MKNSLRFLAALLLLLSAQRSPAQEKAKRDAAVADKKAVVANQGDGRATEVAPKPASVDATYLIAPDDQVDVSVWGEPGVSRSVPVRPDGKISLPLLDDVQAAGLSPMQLGDEISLRLKKFIEAPKVTVIVTKSSSPHIFILGEVVRGGAYPLLPQMTMLAALSSAGGFTPFAKQSKVHILRAENGTQISIPFNYKEAVSGRHPEQNLVLKAGDTIVVP